VVQLALVFVCFIEWLQQIVLIATDCIDRNGMERIEVVVSRGKVRGGAVGTGCEGSR
jgi:hypothetical protein